jgi:large subunit ribosomal protein L6
MLYMLNFNYKMSRIGKQFVDIPEGVNVKLEGQTVLVEGPKGRLAKTLPLMIYCTLDGGCKKLYIEKTINTKLASSLFGLSRTLIANMISGVSSGFEKKVQIVGVGYKVELEGNDLLLNVGYSHPVKMITPYGIVVKVDNPTMLVVSGIQKDVVGEFAAKIRAIRSPEPYKGKGIAYAGEVIRRKTGK